MARTSRTLSRGVIRINPDTSEVETFMNCTIAAQSCQSHRYKGKLQTMSNHIKKSANEKTHAYGYIWENIPGNMKDDQIVARIRIIQATNNFRLLMDQAFNNAVTEEAAQAVEEFLNEAVDVCEYLGKEGYLGIDEE